MRASEYDRVCYRTEQRQERVKLRNRKTGVIGYSFACTESGRTVQVRLNDGDLDSWGREECDETE